MAKVRTVILTEECVLSLLFIVCPFVVLPVTSNYSDCHIIIELLG